MVKARVVCLIILIFIFVLSIGLIGVCAWYKDHYYTTLTCDIGGVTPVDSTTRYNTIAWFFQYDYKGQGCSDGGGVETVYNYDYQDALDEWAIYLNKTTATCYALKHSDQCTVEMSPPEQSDFWAGIILGIILIILDFIAIAVLVQNLDTPCT